MPRAPTQAAAEPKRRPPKRWHRRRDARPAEIVAAALGAFAERGFAAARLDDIAARAGITKGTLYLYFPNKEALLKAVVETALLPNLAQAETLAARDAGAVGTLVAAIATQIGRIIATTPLGAIPKIMLAEAGNFPDLARFYLNAVIGRGLRLFGTLVRRGIAAGEFRAVDPEATARLIIAPILMTALWQNSFAAYEETKHDPADFIARSIDLVLRGLAAAPRGAQP